MGSPALEGFCRNHSARKAGDDFLIPETGGTMPSAGGSAFKTEGWVVSGAGRGAEFLGLEWVRRELRRSLFLMPYPGTLNLRVAPEVRDAVFARRDSFLRIADPSAPECPGYLQRVILRANGLTCPSAYLILPELTMYKDVLEVVSAYHLRQKLNLRDGDRVEIEEFSVG